MNDDDSKVYERRLIHELEVIEAKIVELRQEQEALKRQLMKARWETHTLKDVSRRNSANRVLIEERILDALKETDKALSNDSLFKVAKLANSELKPNTFRTYLFRMKERGLISSHKRGKWIISR